MGAELGEVVGLEVGAPGDKKDRVVVVAVVLVLVEAALSVTVVPDTAETVVFEAMPVPVTELPTTMDDASEAETVAVEDTAVVVTSPVYGPFPPTMNATLVTVPVEYVEPEVRVTVVPTTDETVAPDWNAFEFCSE